MNIIERIRAEIERQSKSIENATGDFAEGRRLEQRVILSFLDTLEEPVNEDLGEEIERASKRYPEVSYAKLARIAKRFAEWQKEQMLKEAVEEPDFPGFEEDKDMVVGRDYVPVDWVETLDLYGRWKIIPMKDAVEGEVHHCMSAHYVVTNENQLAEALKRFNDSDKVRIIIVKED